MKWFKRIFVGIFGAMLILPMLFFNFKKNVASEIDNRMLAENPFEQEGDLSENIEKYVNDRIGFRDEMILSYTVLNDLLFGKMDHRIYSYGQDGYVFGGGLTVNYPYTEYHQAFAAMVKTLQDYCQARGLPFLFVFEPAKPAVYTEYLPKGVNYDRAWVDKFFEELDSFGVRYVDNTDVLRTKKEEGVAVFNRKYDANHWNEWGAYYGTKAVLGEMQKDFPSIHITEKEDLIVGEELQTSLHVSKFPIREKTPTIELARENIENISERYREELYLDKGYPYFYHSVNTTYSNAPRALVFQGSYMNGYGNKYFANAFGEYIAVHDYQNVMNLPYYANIFQPDCVVFEVAEYTLTEAYFSYEKMKNMHVNPCFESLSEEEKGALLPLNGWTVERGSALTEISVSGEDGYAWLQMDRTYDMQKTEGGFEVTVLTEDYDKYKERISITYLAKA